MIPYYRHMNINGVMFKMNKILQTQLDILKKLVRMDFDCVIIIDGEIEGTGKSVLAQQCALFCDNTLDIDRIVFTPEGFENAILNADKYQAVIWDESYEGGNKYQIMTAQNQSIGALLRKIRQKNLFIFIVVPSIVDLSYYIACRRSWALIRAELSIDYEKLTISRGNFSFYNRSKKKWLYEVEAKRLDYRKGYKYSNSFVGFFENVYGVNKQLYLEKKADIDPTIQTIDERSFTQECIRRGMPWASPMKLCEFSTFSEKHFYRLKKEMNSPRTITDGLTVK